LALVALVQQQGQELLVKVVYLVPLHLPVVVEVAVVQIQMETLAVPVEVALETSIQLQEQVVQVTLHPRHHHKATQVAMVHQQTGGVLAVEVQVQLAQMVKLPDSSLVVMVETEPHRLLLVHQ
jgi:hypothetical protein